MAASRTLPLQLLVTVAALLTLALAWPFSAPLFMAAVLAGALKNAQSSLSKRRAMTPARSAFVLVLGVLFVLLLPLAAMISSLAYELAVGVGMILDLLRDGGWPNVLEHLPGWMQEPLTRLGDELGRTTGGGRLFAERLGQAAGALGGVLAATGTALGGIARAVLMLVATYFLLVEGARLIGWVERLSPLAPGETRELLADFRHVSVTVLRSTLLTALVQSATAWAGFVVAHAPRPLLLSFVTFGMALVPTVGAAAACLLVALMMVAIGHAGAALFLALWGVFVVGLIDNVVKPIFIRGGVNLHAAVIFFSLLGGVAVFGPVGLIAGPLVPSFLVAAVRMRERSMPPRPMSPVPREVTRTVPPESRPPGN